MKRLIEALSARTWVAPALLLGALLAAGILAFDDYGVAWDEPVQRQYGSQVYNYVVHGDRELFLDRHRYYGPVFEALFYSLEKALRLEDPRSIYLARHLAGFLVFWAGVGFFYLLAGKIFRSRRLALAAGAMLALSPRIFSHSFYNSKDVPFLAVFVVGAYTLLRYLDRPSLRRAVIHAAACAVAVDTRIVGILLPALTVVLAAWELVRRRAARAGGAGGARGDDGAGQPGRRSGARGASPGGAAGATPGRGAASLGVFLAVWAGATVLLWPTLWRNPVGNFVHVFEGMRNFPWEATVLYLGADVWSTALPWHYTLVWIGVSTPVAYLALFAVGLGVVAGALVGAGGRHPGERAGGGAGAAGSSGPVASRRDLALVLAWFLLPLVYSVASRAVLYDEWRHSFFVYPALLLIALAGLAWLRRAAARLRGRARAVALWAPGVLLALNMAGAAVFLVRNHPNANVYFNSLAGGPGGADGRFELDYWGLAYRQGLEYIVGHDAGESIPVHAATAAGRYNAEMLAPPDRGRIVFEEDPARARYYITTFRWDRKRPPPGREIHAITVEGARILAVYELQVRL